MTRTGRTHPVRRLPVLGSILLLAAGTVLHAQEDPLSWEDLLPELKERAIIMDIVARIVEQNQEVVWHEEDSKVTIPGRPVGLKLVGANIVVAVQFTYFRRDNANFLVAQGQIWIDIPEQGLSYHTTLQTTPLEFGEEISFFPLGQERAGEDDARIEIQLVLHPYSEEEGKAEESAGTLPGVTETNGG